MVEIIIPGSDYQKPNQRGILNDGVHHLCSFGDKSNFIEKIFLIGRRMRPSFRCARENPNPAATEHRLVERKCGEKGGSREKELPGYLPID